MSDIVKGLPAFLAGFALGGFFFAGLWWTVRKGLTSKNPVLWFFGSTLLRTGLAVLGFYFIGQGDWRKLLLCLAGFFLGRLTITRLLPKEKTHAP